MGYGAWPSSQRVKSDWYCQYIRSKPCVVCGGGAEVHHLQTRGSGGSDFTAIPLCRTCHVGVHQLGLKKFEEKYNVNLWKEAWALIVKWTKVEETDCDN